MSDLILTLGMFDGVHLGHQKVLQAMNRIKGKGKSMVLTFFPHPQEFLKKISIPLLTSLETRQKLLLEQGVDEVIVLPFEKELQELEAEEFLHRLISRFDPKAFFLGYDTHLGKGRRGTPSFIKDYLHSRNIEIYQEAPLLMHDLPISSRRIRTLVSKGELEEAKNLLGRSWSIEGFPQKGEGVGKEIGTPTFNFSLEGIVTPPFGVYAALLKAADREIKGVANIGVSPSIKKDSPPLLEIHLLENIANLPPPPYEIIPLDFIRQEMTFERVADLQVAIQSDIKKALSLFSKK